ncbi:MAG: type II toxin-antitoxin system PemK/MazF family toxin [Acidobacteria bacterium]|nr:type II toxin-antitoxin system PemK/MazF family toxin [Acidobacteriota bacterium]
MVKRGDIWLVNLDPTAGSEIQKTRPCVIISPAEMHDHLRTALVAPMTTAGREAPFRIAVTHGGRDGLILLDQVRAVDKIRLVKRLGTISAKTLAATLKTLQEVFAE